MNSNPSGNTPSDTMPRAIGLTGGIGCGKTTVLEAFRTLGVPCFVADSCAGRYYEEAAFLSDIRQLLGDRVFHADGSVDKRAIARIVFSDREALEQLNALIHPRVRRDFERWRAEQAAPFVLFESAILYEYGFDRLMDKVIAVYVEKEERLRRLELRDHASREELEARMRNQLSAEEKMDMADYVVLNYEGNPRARQVASVYRWLLEEK